MLDVHDLTEFETDHVLPSVRDLRQSVIGVDELVPVRDGYVPYVSLDNAASTPVFRFVAETVRRFLPYYSSVHRGSGYKSRGEHGRVRAGASPGR